MFRRASDALNLAERRAAGGRLMAARSVRRNRAAEATMTLPGVPRPVGRPRKPDALTGAERQKAWRQRHKVISVTRNGN